ncbi:uncharacterized protein LOC106463742 isoform X2 [Limulus polyphemus]|uniref:Uncharacterized protein LOC106463742 isoform X2 n=1 Tax=Limulus polyphemus TaxID=6850 RepID=A0ABM1STS7_LIMPO|nr:uncharacterized protein LOC106463742 isoform X2 [Limulus polyphemus]
MESSEMKTVRRSERNIKIRQLYSPEPSSSKTKNRATKKVNRTFRYVLPEIVTQEQYTEVSGKPFCCDICKSPYVIHPHRKIKRRIRNLPAPRHHLDPETNKNLILCNACGLAIKTKKSKRPKKDKIIPSPEEKEKYLREAQAFALSLVEVLRDQDAERLFCPEFKQQPCACLQKYIIGGGDTERPELKAGHLLHLLKEAKQLSRLKCYTVEQNNGKQKKRPAHNVGLGNGQKRSVKFEEFVLQKRNYLKHSLGLCERATQRVLMYSNNFLHKRLKTEPEKGPRVERKKGKAALGLLKPVTDLATETCCLNYCILMAISHELLLEEWRERAKSGQAEARRVLAEMLTPSGGGRTNCYKFISMVTGCSYTTITKVNDQMRRTGGNREPPEHGLKRRWQSETQEKVIDEANLEKDVDKAEQQGTESLARPSNNEISKTTTSTNSQVPVPFSDGKHAGNSQQNSNVQVFLTLDPTSREQTVILSPPEGSINLPTNFQVFSPQDTNYQPFREPLPPYPERPDENLSTEVNKVQQADPNSPNPINTATDTCPLVVPTAQSCNSQSTTTLSVQDPLLPSTQPVHQLVLEGIQRDHFGTQFLNAGLGNIIIIHSSPSHSQPFETSGLPASSLNQDGLENSSTGELRFISNLQKSSHTGDISSSSPVLSSSTVDPQEQTLSLHVNVNPSISSLPSCNVSQLKIPLHPPPSYVQHTAAAVATGIGSSTQLSVPLG